MSTYTGGREMVCTTDYVFEDAFGALMKLGAGEVYRVSAPRNGRVTVFSEPMVMVPVEIFTQRKRRRRVDAAYSRKAKAVWCRRKYWAERADLHRRAA